MTAILLEGPDGAGKTTLLGQLREVLPYARIERRGPPTRPSWIYEYYVPLLRFNPDNGLLADRWHWGERVYPQVLNRPSILGQAAYRWLELYRASRGILAMLLLPPVDVLRQRLDVRGDELITTDQLEDLVQGYRNLLLFGTTDRYVSYHAETHPQSVLTAAHWLEHQAAPLTSWPSYVGRPRPEVLLVGDKPNTRAANAPAFPPFPTSSGIHLLNCLPDSNWEQHGLVNASQPGLYSLWKQLGKPRVVALGREAQRELGRQFIDCGTVPHPQYMRRFHYHDRECYRLALSEAAHTQTDLIKETTT